ncbi:hypothetical protein SAMD00019534_051730 [Acytostelium subglobosum LB1]|uniref:hypothetical protein n=1 Tax=Acytostelium subglobosum LB1 TaxID=1410327 RepID=UPI000644A36D|nr:hypothetical protein SAMD00019534_051730 [Acytostelium subglobosum LB1]GAM21998.1 hypothetical protein SAMD00019534_051730 [Acytostelium subglobosum LB1]|eukprot:XP_012755098.1 hypothetical protein SAMD00019534_051730 [Acytostelium subglobosum LB1]
MVSSSSSSTSSSSTGDAEPMAITDTVAVAKKTMTTKKTTTAGGKSVTTGATLTIETSTGGGGDPPAAIEASSSSSNKATIKEIEDVVFDEDDKAGDEQMTDDKTEEKEKEKVAAKPASAKTTKATAAAEKKTTAAEKKAAAATTAAEKKTAAAAEKKTTTAAEKKTAAAAEKKAAAEAKKTAAAAKEQEEQEEQEAEEEAAALAAEEKKTAAAEKKTAAAEKKAAAAAEKKTAAAEKKAAADAKKAAAAAAKEEEEEEAEEPAPEKPKTKTTKPKAESKRVIPRMIVKEPNEDKPEMTRDEERMAKLRKVEWKDLIPIGFELKELETMRKEPWSFDQLNKELSHGFLSKAEHPLYIFMGAQPIVEKKVALNIPYIVVFDCLTPPPQKVCKASIQGATEEVFDTSKDNRFKVSWLPYIRSKLFNQDFTKIAKPIQALQCNSRGRTSNVIPEEKLIEMQYLLPYIRLPQIVENLKQIDVTAVTFDFEAQLTPEQLEKEKKQAAEDDKKREEEFTSKGKMVRLTKAEKEKMKARDECLARGCKMMFIAYDKAVDTPTAFIDEKKEDDGITDECAIELKRRLKEEFDKARKIRGDSFAAIQKEVADMSPEDKENYRNCKIYKFYPTHPKIDVSKYSSKVVNRFFGNATQVFPEEAVKDLSVVKLASKEELAEAKADYDRDVAQYEAQRLKHEAKTKVQKEDKTTTTSKKRKATDDEPEKKEDEEMPEADAEAEAEEEAEEEAEAEAEAEEEAEAEAEDETQPKKKAKTSKTTSKTTKAAATTKSTKAAATKTAKTTKAATTTKTTKSKK